MSQTASKVARYDEVLPQAFQNGFSTTEMMDANTAIAQRAARLYAQAVGHPKNDSPCAHTCHILPLLKYAGDMPSAEVKTAIADLHKVHTAIGTTGLRQISELLDLHARYSRSHPDSHSADSWTNELMDISVEMQIALHMLDTKGQADRGQEMLRKSCQRLSEVLVSLWS